MWLVIILVAILLTISPSTVYAVYSNAATEAELAENERQFIQPIYDKYIGGNLSNLTAIFANAKNWAQANNFTSTWYRILCSQASLNAIVKGSSLTPEDPYVQYFVQNFSSVNFRATATDPNSPHVKHIAATDCLLAVNLMRHVLPDNLESNILNDLVFITQQVLAELNTAPNSVAYYQNRTGNYGDSQAEEAATMAIYLHMVAKLLADVRPSSLNYSDLYNRAKALADWSFSKCASNCSLRGPHWLVINHQMDPNPNYTLSLLTAHTEIAMYYNQLGLPLPSDIFHPNLRTWVNNVGTALDNYLSANFTYRGNFNLVGSSGNISDTFAYENTTYTLDGRPKYPITSSIPIDRLDHLNSWVQAGTSTLKTYVTRGNTIWHYTCLLNEVPVYCRAEYQNSIGNIWNGVSSGNIWSAFPPPTDSIDALSQWYLPFKTDQKNYIFRANRVWHYICNSNGCNAVYTDTLGNFWPTNRRSEAGWITNTPPSSVDAVSAFIIPNTRELRTYGFKGNRVWVSRCLETDTPSQSCEAMYTQNLSSFWQQIGGDWAAAGWNTNPPPTDSVDSFHAYYNPDNITQRLFIFKGNRVWSYSCASGGCSPLYTQNLTTYFAPIRSQFKWPPSPTTGIQQMRGISDWAHDGTIQNNAFSTLYIVDPTTHNLNRFQRLQTEQTNRGRKTTTLPFPVNYNSGAWNYQNFTGTKYTAPLWLLMDGFHQTHGVTGRQMDTLPATTDLMVNTHWWNNMLAARNHVTAYLALTPNKHMGSFLEPRPTLPPISGDFNGDRQVNLADIQAIIAQFATIQNGIYIYNQTVANFGN